MKPALQALPHCCGARAPVSARAEWAALLLALLTTSCNWLQGSFEPHLRDAGTASNAMTRPSPDAMPDDADVALAEPDAEARVRPIPMDGASPDDMPTLPQRDGGTHAPDSSASEEVGAGDGPAPAPNLVTPLVDTEFCASVQDSTPEEISKEDDALKLLNEVRSGNVPCSGGPAVPLRAFQSNAALRCAARLDARARTHPSDAGVTESLQQRTLRAGWPGGVEREISMTQIYTSDEVRRDLMAMHCDVLTNASFDQIGIGYDTERLATDAHNWTIIFGNAVGLIRSELSDHGSCAAFTVLPAEWARSEQELLTAINEQRARGATCRDGRRFEPAPALTLDPTLHCLARARASQVEAKGSLDGDEHIPTAEISTALARERGWSGGPVYENLADEVKGLSELMVRMIDSIEHCTNIMRPGSTRIGVGHHLISGDDTPTWSMAFGQDP
jgi:uncharacterized protein YkwD